MTRKIGIVTTARSEFGIYRSLLRRLAREKLDFGLLVGGMHLLPEHGHTVDEIVAEGWPILARVKMPMETQTPQALARSMGQGTTAMGDALADVLPDLVVVLGDRFEMHAAALATVPFGIPMAHIHGGELTFGAMDDAFRHSLTKLSHLHFASAPEYGRRIVQMGEEPWRVHVSGAPSLDSFLEEETLSAGAVESRFGIRLSPAPVLITLHSETRGVTPSGELAALLIKALAPVPGPFLITAPNADPGGPEIAAALRDFAASREDAFYVESLGARAYRTVLAAARFMIGNSSSGVIEAASFALPVINIGHRQDGRMRPANVIDVPAEPDAVARAIIRVESAQFRAGLAGMTNPYGDGRASERIVAVLRDIPLDARLHDKRFHDLAEMAS